MKEKPRHPAGLQSVTKKRSLPKDERFRATPSNFSPSRGFVPSCLGHSGCGGEKMRECNGIIGDFTAADTKEMRFIFPPNAFQTLSGCLCFDMAARRQVPLHTTIILDEIRMTPDRAYRTSRIPLHAAG